MRTLKNIICRPQSRPVGMYHLTVDNGLIKKISAASQDGAGADTVDLSGLALLPRGVDAQTHLRVPGQPEKETAETGLLAAFRGGYSAVLTMPNTRPVIDNVAVLKSATQELAAASHKNAVQVLFSAAVTIQQKGLELAPLTELAHSGVRAFTDDGRGVMSDELMKAALEICAETGLPFLQHAEMEGHGGVLAPGPVQSALGVWAYPESAEVDMVRRDLSLLAAVPRARYHVLHVSSAQTVELVTRARKLGLRVSAEVSPHHLYFDSQQIRAENSSFKMNPPLRSPKDRELLLQALADGRIDFVATDHAPHEASAKTTDFAAAANGTLGLETTLPVLTAFWQDKKLSLDRLIDVWSQRPAEFLGLPIVDPIEENQPLRGLFCDLNAKPQTWSESDFHSLSKNSCFIDAVLPKPIVAIANERGLHVIDSKRAKGLQIDHFT